MKLGCNLIAALFVVAVVSAEIDPNTQQQDESGGGLDQPRKINKDTFVDVIAEPEVGSLVMFYAPWCGHCKRMVSTWSQLARKHNSNGKFLIAKVDCADQTELCSDNDVLGYPTFLYFKKNSPNGVFYDGKRDIDSIDAYLYEFYMHRNDPSSEPFDIGEPEEPPVVDLDEKTFDEFVSKGFHFVKFFAPWCGHCKRLAPIWEELGDKFYNTIVRIAKVDCTKSAEICAKHGVRGYPTLLFFYNGKMVKQYDRERTIDQFSNFIEELVEFYEPSDSTTTTTATTTTTPTPPSMIISNDNTQTEDAKLVDLPGHVAELDDDTFPKFMARKGITFVKFYAPWCSHCQAMAQTWIDLAAKLKPHESVRIADVDCTKSGELCMNQHVQGYPTLILFVNGNRVNDYQHDRSLASLEQFVLNYLQHEDL